MLIGRFAWKSTFIEIWLYFVNITCCLIAFLSKEKPSAEVSPKPYPKLSTGEELRLTCRVNKATVAIKWKKNDDDVIPRAQINTRVDNKLSKLLIVEVVEGDSGEYSCEARNRPGIVARSTVKINVKSVKSKMDFLVFFLIWE